MTTQLTQYALIAAVWLFIVAIYSTLNSKKRGAFAKFVEFHTDRRIRLLGGYALFTDAIWVATHGNQWIACAEGLVGMLLFVDAWSAIGARMTGYSELRKELEVTLEGLDDAS